MSTLQTLARIEVLVWVLIYGGLLTLALGVASRSRAPDAAFWLLLAGAVLAAVGILLVWVRSRMRAED